MAAYFGLILSVLVLKASMRSTDVDELELFPSILTLDDFETRVYD